MACFCRLFDLQLSFVIRCNVLFCRAAKKLSDFLFLFWLLRTCAFRFCFRVFSQMLIVKIKEWISSQIHLTIVARIDLFLLLIQITIGDQTVNM